jgi:predicted MFS family arabinose efflux permease
MSTTFSGRRLVGALLCAVALGMCIGDLGARFMGWDGPTTMQFIGAVLALVGAFLVPREAPRSRERDTPAAPSSPTVGPDA